MYFAGPADKNIKYIESSFKSNIVLRGDELYVDGDGKEIKVLEKLVHNMIYTIAKKNHISTADIKILMNSDSSGKSNGIIKDNSNENIILYTHKEPIYA